MQTGTKISGIAHLGLIAVAIFGGAFRSEPLPFEVHEVSVISSEDFAALSVPRQPPQIADEPAAPEPPEPLAETPKPIARPEPEPVQAEPEPVPEPAEPDDAVVPEPTATPEIDRVAPEPVVTPPEDARPDVIEQAEVTPDEGAETPQEAQEATAPEQATDRIVTEAVETARLAPLRSPRPPRSRPTPPAPTPVAEPAPEAEPAPDTSTASAVDAAVAAALAGPATEPDAPVGPPLSAGEKDALRVAVSQCWNVDVGGKSSQVVVTVAMSLDQSGKVIGNSVRLLGSEGGNEQSVQTAFQAARRAILRCQKTGYELPADKYAQWRDIEMTFNPERMRIK
ncbi:energy transducer TonB [Sedimentitalea todarodis]|uniref:Energy transducer TonB n=1 Tax=Sedimentitalea todarodis TaxID=1631240 RepID=A0ABU3V8G0_9RHOB|nr:energy transducer TonB [Sedimentitalea todarodis]MDU9002451.1 energy transducer TonB [Sedimentitalea todarodis]